LRQSLGSMAQADTLRSSHRVEQLSVRSALRLRMGPTASRRSAGTRSTLLGGPRPAATCGNACPHSGECEIHGKDGVAGSIPAGAPPQTSSSGRVQHPACRVINSRPPRCQKVCQTELYVLAGGASPAEATSCNGGGRPHPCEILRPRGVRTTILSHRRPSASTVGVVSQLLGVQGTRSPISVVRCQVRSTP